VKTKELQPPNNLARELSLKFGVKERGEGGLPTKPVAFDSILIEVKLGILLANISEETSKKD